VQQAGQAREMLYAPWSPCDMQTTPLMSARVCFAVDSTLVVVVNMPIDIFPCAPKVAFMLSVGLL